VLESFQIGGVVQYTRNSVTLGIALMGGVSADPRRNFVYLEFTNDFTINSIYLMAMPAGTDPLPSWIGENGFLAGTWYAVS
jgi:hypothetical protein